MATRKANTTARGLGWRHQQQRDALLRKHVEGSPCWWCGEPKYRNQDLAADHSIARAVGGTVADRLLHSDCNSQRGDGSRDHLRPALTGQQLGRHVDNLGHRLMPWPS